MRAVVQAGPSRAPVPMQVARCRRLSRSRRTDLRTATQTPSGVDSRTPKPNKRFRGRATLPPVFDELKNSRATSCISTVKAPPRVDRARASAVTYWLVHTCVASIATARLVDLSRETHYGTVEILATWPRLGWVLSRVRERYVGLSRLEARGLIRPGEEQLPPRWDTCSEVSRFLW